MKLLARYVLFYCDDCNLLAPAIEAFTGVHRYHTVLTSSEEKDFVTKLSVYCPELILVYLNDPSKDYVSLVRVVRDSGENSSVPVLIYKTLPGPDDLISTFQKLQNFSSV